MAAVDPADHRVPRHFRAGDCGCGVLRDQCVFRWQPDQPGCHGDRAGRGGDGHDLHVGPAVGLHINAAVTFRLTARGVSRRAGLCRTGWLSSPGRSALPCSCRRCSVTSPRVGVPDLQARRGLAGIRHRDRHDGPGRFCCIASTPGRSVAGHLAMATGIDLRRRTRSHHGRGSGRVVVHGCVGFPRQ